MKQSTDHYYLINYGSDVGIIANRSKWSRSDANKVKAGTPTDFGPRKKRGIDEMSEKSLRRLQFIVRNATIKWKTAITLTYRRMNSPIVSGFIDVYHAPDQYKFSGK